MPDPANITEGSSYLWAGADSYTAPVNLNDNEYVMGQNVVCRGGLIQTRPGTATKFCLPDGTLQGLTMFVPDNGVTHLVAAVDGKIYVSPAPFNTFRRLCNLQFSPTAQYIAWATTLKSTDYNIDGELITLDNPYSVLMIQDGVTRAGYWDGSISGHLNPSPVSETTDIVVPGYNETPVGLWMIWSGNRLWVSQGNKLLASDIGNPLKFTESIYLNEARAFYLPSEITGIIATPDDQGIIVFTENNGTYFQSSIQQRELWLATPNFQRIIIPSLGCVAPRSLVTQYGLTWWFTGKGFTNVDAALRQNITSRIDYKDNQMFSSKAYLGPDLSNICASFYENYLFVSVPSGDVLNRHTWVLDQAPFEGNANAWPGFWTGWRPVEWARGLVDGTERIFFASIDYDGKNRVWEAMLPERTDNGCQITCFLQTREHAAGSLDLKQYEYTKWYLKEIYGDVTLKSYIAATKGGFQLQKEWKVVSTKGQVFGDTLYSDNPDLGELMMGNRPQVRTLKTPAAEDNDACNQCGVESKTGNLIDYAFSALLVWSGQAGVQAYQIKMRPSPERDAGDCEEDETGIRTLNANGCGGNELFISGGSFQTYEYTLETEDELPNGNNVLVIKKVTSGVSDSNAQDMAECQTTELINQLSQIDIEVGIYEIGEPEDPNYTYIEIT